MANGKKKEARGHVALECTECKENKGLSKENYFVSKNRTNTPEAYERLLKSCMDSDKSLFSQWEQIETSWKYINKIVDSYKKYSNKLYFYEAASNGPAESF